MTYRLIWNDGQAFNVPQACDGITPHPCNATTREALPYRYRAAFDRSNAWSHTYTCLGGRLESVHRTLVMRSGKIVTIYAHEESR